MTEYVTTADALFFHLQLIRRYGGASGIRDAGALESALHRPQTGSGRELYMVTGGEVTFEGKDLLAMSPEVRAREGIFLAFQYPVEIPGVSNTYFLRAALNAVRKHRGIEEFDAMDFLAMVRGKMKLLEMDESLMTRSVNEGFSGGEKKRNEILDR